MIWLADAGLLDIISSDYVPASLLAAGLMLGDMWGDTARGISTITAAPAAVAGLPDRGHLTQGARADVIRVTRHDRSGAVRGVWVQGQRVG